MSRFERFVVTVCPWLFGSVCFVVSLLVGAVRPEARTIWVVTMCSGFILLTLHGAITVLLQFLKTMDTQQENTG